MAARRDFLTVHLPVGFALAVQPIAAQTAITTDTAGLTAGEVQIPTRDGKSMPAYRACPAKGGKFPVVLVVEEIFGIHEYIKDICRRWAKMGYLAVAPDLFMRQGDVTQIKEIPEIIAKVVSKVPDEQVMSDLDATLAWSEKNKGNSNKLAVTGYCWGGRITWLYAAHQPKVKAGGAWYGVLARPTNPLQPKHPVDIAPGLKASVLGLYGGQDRGIPLDTVEKMKVALKQGSSRSEIVVYPDAPHGFHADYRESYRKADAEDAWKKLTAWFRQHGVA